ncbi:MAG: hypothetical protein QME79_02350 [Bacillota bacterium]|nr:hypothetical protein [Bacillota bacterium]
MRFCRLGLSAIVLIGLGLISADTSVAAEGTVKLTYHQVTQAQGIYEAYTLTPSASGYELKLLPIGQDPSVTSIIRTDSLYSTLTWEHREPREGTALTAVRQGNVIRLSGSLRGKRVEKEYRIDSHPWMQGYALQLTGFILSKEKRTVFWRINPVDLKITAFSATKTGQVTLTVDGKAVETVHVRISFPGAAGAFWSADSWFRKLDGRYLRYRGANGPPGTPVTTVELVAEE